MARILIAEDEILFRRSLVQDLASMGHAVVGESSSGEDVVELVRLHSPDLLIMDIHMASKFDGLQACRTINRTDPGVKIILMSGYPRSAFQPFLEDVSFSAYLEKVFSREKLKQAIDELEAEHV